MVSVEEQPASNHAEPTTAKAASASFAKRPELFTPVPTGPPLRTVFGPTSWLIQPRVHYARLTDALPLQKPT